MGVVDSRAMSDYTVKNLETDVDDAAQAFGLSPSLEAHFGRTALGSDALGVSLERLAPNFRVPFGHRHTEQEEVYVVLSGGGRIKLDDEIVELKPWDAVRIGKDTMRCVEAGPDGIELLAIGASRTPEGARDAELTQGWWVD